MNPTYQVKYSYYQHNDGRANNGQYSQTLDRDTLAEALAIAKRIQAVIDGTATPEEEEQTFTDFHPYYGHFSWIKVYEVTRKEILT